MTYKDMTFCARKCVNTRCERNLKNIENDNRQGLPLSMADFKDCKDYREVEPTLVKCELQYMFDVLIDSIVYKCEDRPKFFWKNSDGEYDEIVEVDLMRGRFKTSSDDFSEYEWELDKSHIYVEE